MATVDRRKSLRREEDRTQYVRRDELSEVVQAAVAAALRDYQHECVFDMSPEEVKQVENMMFAIKEIGCGDLGKGITTIRENHKLIARYVNVTGKIGTTVITILIVGLVGWALDVFSGGIVARLKQALGGG